MAKLNTTDRKLLAKEILRKISNVSNETPNESVDKYIVESGQKKQVDSIIKKEAKIEALKKEIKNEVSELVLPNGRKYENSYLYTSGRFRSDVANMIRSKRPSQEDIETKILLSGDTDLNTLVESIVAEYNS